MFYENVGKISFEPFPESYGFSYFQETFKRKLKEELIVVTERPWKSIGKIKTFLIKIKFTEYLIKALQYNCPRTIGGNKKKT
jgi:hypothetical protein